jgi:hypothetical protein
VCDFDSTLCVCPQADYADESTLKNRLRRLAEKLNGLKERKDSGSQGGVGPAGAVASGGAGAHAAAPTSTSPADFRNGRSAQQDAPSGRSPETTAARNEENAMDVHAASQAPNVGAQSAANPPAANGGIPAGMLMQAGSSSRGGSSGPPTAPIQPFSAYGQAPELQANFSHRPQRPQQPQPPAQQPFFYQPQTFGAPMSTLHHRQPQMQQQPLTQRQVQSHMNPQSQVPASAPPPFYPPGGSHGPMDSSGSMSGVDHYAQGSAPQPARLEGGGGLAQGPPRDTSASVLSSGAGGQADDARRQLMLRQQQQRLLLLRHAYKCPYTNGTCPVTRYCAGIKQLWSHISGCQDKRCGAPHCLSSRIILAHYHSCQDAQCAICAPVRSAIRQTMLKAQQMQAGKQLRPEAARLQGQQYQQAPTHAQDPQPQVSRARMEQDNVSSQRPVVPLKRPRLEGGGNLQDTSGGRGQMDASDVSVNAASRSHATAAAPVLDSLTIPEDNALLVESMTIEQIEAHLASLDTSKAFVRKKLKSWCIPLHKFLWDQPNGWWFHKRVDPVKMELPDYFDVVKEPMDLTIIRKRLDGNMYREISTFEADVELVFTNAMLYNEEGTDVYEVAKEMLDKFRGEAKEMKGKISAEIERARNMPNVCPLCMNANLKFEPITYYCHGTSCSGRLRRNANYFCVANEEYKWCMTCYQELSDQEPIEAGVTVTYKAQLEKRKNDEVNEEPWVHCDGCDR